MIKRMGPRAGRLRNRPHVVRARHVTYGFIGLGQMGLPMAENLAAKLTKQDVLYVNDVDSERVKQFTETSRAKHLQNVEIAQQAEIIITMLPQPVHVQAVLGEITAQRAPATPRLFIDSSTVDVSTSLDVATSIRNTGWGEFVDAPVSGGVVGAQAGTLTFMLGAHEAMRPRVESVLHHMGKRVMHCGPPGSGLAAKLTNNYLLAISNIATAEAMNLGLQLGLTESVVAGVVNASTGRCWSSEVNNPIPGILPSAPASRGYAGGFGVSLMKKDLSLALLAAKQWKAPLELGPQAARVYEQVDRNPDFRSKDFSVVYQWLKQRNS